MNIGSSAVSSFSISYLSAQVEGLGRLCIYIYIYNFDHWYLPPYLLSTFGTEPEPEPEPGHKAGCRMKSYLLQNWERRLIGMRCTSELGLELQQPGQIS